LNEYYSECIVFFADEGYLVIKKIKLR